MLSGGGQLGNFHLGVLKALVENDLLPSVISGSSAGSIFAALVGTYNNHELLEYFDPQNILMEIEAESSIVVSLLQKRGKMSQSDLQDVLERVIPDLTFQEALEKTGRKINISIAPFESNQKSRLLNAIASPNVLIRSAIMASCAIPGVFPPVTLMAKNKDGVIQEYLPERRWVDGSLSNDLPSKRLARMYGVNHFIVSMANPLVLPFVNDKAKRSNIINAAMKFSRNVIQETAQLQYTLSKPFFKSWPKFAVLASNLNSIVQQEYSGDINIIADFSVVGPRTLLSQLTGEELADLIRSGEKATWPKLENIRITTRVGRLLDDILDHYEKQGIAMLKKADYIPN